MKILSMLHQKKNNKDKCYYKKLLNDYYCFLYSSFVNSYFFKNINIYNNYHFHENVNCYLNCLIIKAIIFIMLINE